MSCHVVHCVQALHQPVSIGKLGTMADREAAMTSWALGWVPSDTHTRNLVSYGCATDRHDRA